ncbi:MAG: hypothetical protein EBZ47_09465, partial [Chlamydiae bacterium]|nr:hypothetical protein [Chlamydiota bacterium]
EDGELNPYQYASNQRHNLLKFDLTFQNLIKNAFQLSIESGKDPRQQFEKIKANLMERIADTFEKDDPLIQAAADHYFLVFGEPKILAHELLNLDPEEFIHQAIVKILNFKGSYPAKTLTIANTALKELATFEVKGLSLLSRIQELKEYFPKKNRDLVNKLKKHLDKTVSTDFNALTESREAEFTAWEGLMKAKIALIEAFDAATREKVVQKGLTFKMVYEDVLVRNQQETIVAKAKAFLNQTAVGTLLCVLDRQEAISNLNKLYKRLERSFFRTPAGASQDVTDTLGRKNAEITKFKNKVGELTKALENQTAETNALFKKKEVDRSNFNEFLKQCDTEQVLYKFSKYQKLEEEFVSDRDAIQSEAESYTIVLDSIQSFLKPIKFSALDDEFSLDGIHECTRNQLPSGNAVNFDACDWLC